MSYPVAANAAAPVPAWSTENPSAVSPSTTELAIDRSSSTSKILTTLILTLREGTSRPFTRSSDDLDESWMS